MINKQTMNKFTNQKVVNKFLSIKFSLLQRHAACDYFELIDSLAYQHKEENLDSLPQRLKIMEE